VKVGDTNTWFCSPPNRANTVKYSAGNQLLVLVGSDTLTFNSAPSGKPRCRSGRETLRPESRLVAGVW
jgi:hypothetical protein